MGWWTRRFANSALRLRGTTLRSGRARAIRRAAPSLFVHWSRNVFSAEVITCRFIRAARIRFSAKVRASTRGPLRGAMASGGGGGHATRQGARSLLEPNWLRRIRVIHTPDSCPRLVGSQLERRQAYHMFVCPRHTAKITQRISPVISPNFPSSLTASWKASTLTDHLADLTSSGLSTAYRKRRQAYLTSVLTRSSLFAEATLSLPRSSPPFHQTRVEE